MSCEATSSVAEVGEEPKVVIATGGQGADKGEEASVEVQRTSKDKGRAVEVADDGRQAATSSSGSGGGGNESRVQHGAATFAHPSAPVEAGVPVSASSLHAALTALAASPPSTLPFSPTPTPLSNFPSHPDVLPQPSSSALTTFPATPAQPLTASTSPFSRSRSNSRARSRLSAFRDRLSPSRSTSALETSTTEDDGTTRPKRRRRFSRSLPSFTPHSQDQPRLVGPSTTIDATTASAHSKWRDKGKGKLRQLLVPNSSTSTAGKSVARPQLEIPVSPTEPVRSSSRTRAYSEPLLRTVDPASPNEAPSAAAPAQLEDPLSVLSAYCTAVSSPTADEFPSSALTADSAVEPELEPEPEPDRFAELPRELQLKVFRALLKVCEEDWRREVKEGEWVGEKARERWSEGEARGRRELVRLGRVSKLWRALSLDGQLWPTAPASSLLGADVVDPDGVLSLFEHGGQFIRELDAKGLGKTLTWRMLDKMVEAAKGFEVGGTTGLTKIDLTGCTSIASASLSSLLSHSPQLIDLTLLGLPFVTASHMSTLGSSCPHLTKLDVSRCPRLSAVALLHLPYPPKRRPSSPSDEASSRPRGLRTLRASSLSGMGDTLLVELLDRYPALEVLDLSFSSHITRFGLKRAATQPVEVSLAVQPTIHRRSTRTTATSRPSQPIFSSTPSHTAVPVATTKPIQRVYPSLRHLNLSACPLLDYSSLSHLAGSFPNLEILELSRFTGGGGRTDGLVSLLSTTPRLRKLDIEDADEANDEVLLTLAQHTPQLTHLLVSSCVSFTDAAFSALVNRCPNLRVLEADGTAISHTTAKAFVGLAKERAARAQDAAASKYEVVDPLVRSKHPAVLSVLDNRQTGRRLSRDVGADSVRPRTGQRGYWAKAVDFYHDGQDEANEVLSGRNGGKKSVLDETDEQRVAVRSFYSSLAVDAATALRDSKAAKKASKELKGKKSGLLRSRAMSDSEVLRLTNEAEGRPGCTIS